MSVLAIGMSHRSAPLTLLERAVVAAPDTPKLLDELLRCPSVDEVGLLSTCNRVEVYAVVESFHSAVEEITGVLSRHAGVDGTELTDGMYVHYAAAAVEHLFTVASGLDSMVVGEEQILGQLRNAYTSAETAKTVGKTLHELLQQALRVGKRAHSETEIGAEGASVVSEALSDATELLGTLTGRRALVVGAGSMGGLAAAHLRRAGIAEIVVANRTADNGARLAEITSEAGTPARSVGLAGLADELAEADVAIVCTGSLATVVDVATVRAALAKRTSDGPLVFCDLGLPRDVDAEVGELAGVAIVDLETLRGAVRGSVDGGAFGAVNALITAEVEHYFAAQRSASVTPTVTALRKRAAEVVDAELLRLDSRLPDLDAGVRSELSRTVRRVVDKLLHTPTVRVKQLAGSTPGAGYADALRELFNLDQQLPGAVSSLKAGTTADAAEPVSGTATPLDETRPAASSGTPTASAVVTDVPTAAQGETPMVTGLVTGTPGSAESTEQRGHGEGTAAQHRRQRPGLDGEQR